MSRTHTISQGPEEYTRLTVYTLNSFLSSNIQASWSIAWIYHLNMVYQRYNVPRNHWIYCGSGTTQCVICTYISNWKIPLKIIAALLMVKRRKMWRLESSDYLFLPLRPKTDKQLRVLLLQFPPAALVLDNPAKCSYQTKHPCFLHCC